MFLVPFLFLSFNREMAPFHIDLRFALVAVGVVCLLFSVHALFRSKRLSLSGLERTYLAYFACVLMSFTAIVWNNQQLELPDYPGLAVVHLLNALAVVLVILNKDLLSFKKTAVVLCASGIILAASQVAVYFDVDLSAFLKSDEVRVMAQDKGQGEHLNFFGQLFRISGFAEDPNYACLFNILAIAMALAIRRDRPRLASITVILSAVGVMLSWSRTVVFGSVGIALVVALARYLKAEKALYSGFLAVLIPAAIALPFLRIDVLQTITTRYRLWENAFDLFCQSPLFGNGLTSFRYYNASVQNGWVVHPHSSLWETLSEFGAIAFAVLLLLYLLSLYATVGSPFAGFSVMLLILFSIKFDCTYLQIMPGVLLVLPLSVDEGEETQGKSTSPELSFSGVFLRGGNPAGARS